MNADHAVPVVLVVFTASF